MNVLMYVSVDYHKANKCIFYTFTINVAFENYVVTRLAFRYFYTVVSYVKKRLLNTETG